MRSSTRYTVQVRRVRMRKMANLLDASDDDELANSGFERMQKAVAIVST